MAIRFSVYTCQPIPTEVKVPNLSSEDSGVWSPLSCTLIYTPIEALLVDCPATIAATAELATWVKSTLPDGCTLKHFMPSHAHGDHFMGFPVLQQHFPDVTAVASQRVVEGVSLQYAPPTYDGLWKACFPSSELGTGLPSKRAVVSPLPPSNVLDLDGHSIQVYDVAHGDCPANLFVHVPELDLVVAGDLVYNGDCHQWLGEASTQERRDQWIQGLHQIAALKPKVVVAGHTFDPVLEPNESRAALMLKGTEEYIRGFEKELGLAETEGDLFQRMRARYPRWNLWILDGGCKAGMSAKQT